VKRAIAIFVFLLFSCAQQRAEQLPIHTYTTADGLPRDGVYKIVPDPRGFIWFCTSDGLSRFDGYEFVNYSVAQGLPHRAVLDLLITRNGDYWVATSAGVARFNPLASNAEPKFKTYLPTGRPDAAMITDLYEDSSATVWVGTGNGLHKLRQSGADWQLEYVGLGEKTDEQLDVTKVVEDSPGILWIGTVQGLFRRFSDGKAERFSTTDGLPHLHVRDILRDPDGTVWIATARTLPPRVERARRPADRRSRLHEERRPP
jgi:ligand-binding sensor domain-containing protein